MTTRTKAPSVKVAVSLDVTFALDAALGAGRGISAAAFEALAARAPALLAATAAERAAGKLPFLDLPVRSDLVEPVLGWAKARHAKTSDLLLIGIGGSSRGLSALAATRRATGQGSRGNPRLHVLDTVDPRRAREVFELMNPAATTVVAVSKAGTTTETVAGFLLAESWLEKRVGRAKAKQQVALVSGEEPNPMRDRATERGYASFPVPRGVGGRFSVLSPVGMLPAGILGIDVEAVLAGAAAVRARCENADPAANPALALGMVHHLAAASGRPATVCLPYADALQPFGLWWTQLVGESIGKRGPTGAVGVTPLPGVGPSDQHSLLQLLIDGPDHHLVVFIESGRHVADHLKAPRGGEAMSIASGRRLGEILAAEREATELALVEAGRPSVTIRVPDTGARSMGALLFLYEAATMLWGRMAGVDPFDQPAVERGKVLTRASLTGAPPEAVAALARHRAMARRMSS